jgi:hypothetical protein
MTAIWGTDASGSWQLLPTSPFPQEQKLHELVAGGPQMLPLSGAPRLAVLGSEVVLGSGRADILAVESSGRLVIIEVKLATNPEARRAVVAQVLAYAAYLQGLDVAYLETVVLGKYGATSVFDVVRDSAPQEAIDQEAFQKELATSLAEGSFRLVLVLDSIPDELTELVGYLESVSPGIVIDLVAVSSYEVGGTSIVVPQRVDPARRVKKLSAAEAQARQANAAEPGAEAFEIAMKSLAVPQQEFLAPLVSWARKLSHAGLVNLASFRGKNSITTLLPRLKADNVGLVTIGTDSKKAYLQLWQSVFDTRAPRSAARVAALLKDGEIGQGKWLLTIPPELLPALTAAYEEAAGPAVGGGPAHAEGDIAATSN